MDHSQQLRLPSLPFLLLFLLLLHCPIIKGFEQIDPPPNRTDIRESCPHVFEVLIDTDNYTLVDNDTALLFQGDYFNVSFYDNFSRPVICRDLSVVSVNVILITAAISITSLSILASMALLITYSLFRTLRTFPSKVIMNLAAAFIAGDVCYMVIISLLFSGKSETWSYHVFILVWFYFIYARFMWMSLAGFEMCRNIYYGLKLKAASQREKKNLLICYLLLGWGVPLLLGVFVVAVAITLNESFYEIVIYFTTLPITVIMILFNIGVVILLSFMLRNAAKNRNKVNNTVKRSNTIFVRVFLVILTVLGLPYVLWLLRLNKEVDIGILFIFHVLLNLSQPLVVSIAFIGTKKVIRKYLELCGCKDKDKKRKTKE